MPDRIWDEPIQVARISCEPDNRDNQGVVRLSTGRFARGVSGNPAGRPKAVRDVAAAAREFTHEALATLVEVMRDRDTPPGARAAAAVHLLDRAWGKPPQSVAIADARNEERTEELHEIFERVARNVTLELRAQVALQAMEVAEGELV